MTYKKPYQRSLGASLRALASDPETLVFLSQNAASVPEEDAIERGALQAAIASCHRVRPLKMGYEVRWVVEATIFDSVPVEIVVLSDHDRKRITVLAYQRIETDNAS
jgi:hypothetical protein